jgi:UDP-N-acetylglucosamine 4,6-dehydratase
MGSRGSVIPFFRKQREKGVIPITDTRMTRFWITLEQAVEFVAKCATLMQGGEIFVPKLPSMRITDLAKAIAPEAEVEIVGIRPGEKLHETLLTEDEARRALELPDFYVVKPTSKNNNNFDSYLFAGKPVPEDFRYSSNSNSWWMTIEEMRNFEEEQIEPEYHSLRAAIA